MEQAGRSIRCPDDATLKDLEEGQLSPGLAEQVISHVATCPGCNERRGDSGEVATAVIEPPAGSLEASAHDETPLQRGASLGRYIVLEQVGEGGMGVVYAAYDPELDRKVAIKLLQASARASQSTDGRERLIREAQALARLSHPNVVHVHDVGTHGDRVFMAMELVEGRSLRAWLREKARSWREVTAAFLSAGRGLSAAHAVGLIHRDCKPDNLHVGKDGRVRVLDFGVARQLDSDGPEPIEGIAPSTDRVSLSIPLTHAGTVLGTPSYLPPEVWNGQPADPRSDQFSFCVSLYEALYGVRPFSASLPRNDPGRWKLREPAQETKVPPWIRKVVLRGLSLSPDQRYPTMDALLEDLGRDPRATPRKWLVGAAMLGAASLVSGGVYVQIRSRPVPCQGLEQSLERNWNASTRQALESAFLSTGKGFAEGAWRNTERTLDAYASAWTAMRQDACAATRIRGEQSDEVLSLRMACLDRRMASFQALTELFAKADGALVQRAVRAANELPGLELCANVQALRAPVPPPEGRTAQARVETLRKQLAEAQALLSAGRYEPSLELVKSAVESARALAYRPLEAEALELLVLLQTNMGNFNAAEETLHQAVWAAEAGRHDFIAASVLAKSVGLAGLQSRPDIGRHWAEHARASLERVGGDARIEASLLNGLGIIEFREGKMEAARESLENALALRLKVYGPDHPEVAALHNNISNVLVNGQPGEAITHLEKSLAIMERAYGPDHPDIAATLVNLGNIAFELVELTRALEYFRRGLAVAQKGLGPEHPAVAIALGSIGNVLTRQGSYDEAISNLRRAVSIYEAATGPEHIDVARLLLNLGVALKEKGELKVGLETLERAMAIARKSRPPDYPENVTFWHSLADAELALGRMEDARVHFERSVELAKKVFGPAHQEVATAYVGLGSWHLHEKHFREAVTLFEKARDIQDKALGAEHPHLSRTLALMGRARLGLGAWERAIPELERAIALAQIEGAPPGTLEEARFALARALWESKGDRARAVELASQARDGYVRRGYKTKALSEVKAWLTRTTRP